MVVRLEHVSPTITAAPISFWRIMGFHRASMAEVEKYSGSLRCGFAGSHPIGSCVYVAVVEILIWTRYYRGLKPA